jgi:hypothetical protein
MTNDPNGGRNDDQQGPSDWSRETPSDDQLSDEARERIRQVLEELAGRERRDP